MLKKHQGRLYTSKVFGMSDAAIVIENAESFWNVVDDFLQREAAEPGTDLPIDLDFQGWPNLHINVKGDKFHSSLTSSMVYGLASMHESFQRAYALAKYGTSNLQRLTNEDKQSLDIIFQIKEGSTDSETDWSGTFNQFLAFLTGAFEGMSGVQKMTILLSLIIALTAGGCFYLHTNSQDHHADLDAQTQTTQTVVGGMTRAFELGGEVKRRGETAVSREIEAHGEDGKASLLKSVAQDAESVKVGNQKYDGAALQDYKNRQSVDRERTERFDNFYIKGISRSGMTSTELNLSVIRVSNGESFTIKVAEDIARPEELKALAGAIVTGEVVRISYLEVTENGHVARGQFNLIISNDPPTHPEQAAN
ncbi:hypothetical protein I7V28_01095 [Lelliottia amnigena]|uniref:hypothetical protein n=1 Tax=Lelliottia amnigena TaxID=61646 RepID=UPI00192A8633|nr:hypothetical protein [Lelliottia amnigena]MBL5919732.1 hypothetical protein [Lelliottia amnigena]